MSPMVYEMQQTDLEEKEGRKNLIHVIRKSLATLSKAVSVLWAGRKPGRIIFFKMVLQMGSYYFLNDKIVDWSKTGHLYQEWVVF